MNAPKVPDGSKKVQTRNVSIQSLMLILLVPLLVRWHLTQKLMKKYKQCC